MATREFVEAVNAVFGPTFREMGLRRPASVRVGGPSKNASWASRDAQDGLPRHAVGLLHRLMGDSYSFTFEFAVYGTPDRLTMLMDKDQRAQAAKLQRRIVDRMPPVPRTRHAGREDDYAQLNLEPWLVLGHLLDLGEWGTLIRPWIPELFTRLEQRVPM